MSNEREHIFTIEKTNDMKKYQAPETKMLRFVTRPVMLDVSVKLDDPVNDPDDENGGLVNQRSVWDEE